MTTTAAVDQPKLVEEIAPVRAASRIDSLDVLRGFAVLGILVMNIQSFGLPMMAYMNPAIYGDFTGVEYWIWVVGHLLADLKFMSIFSMLFGAGIILFTSRIEAKGRSAAGIHYRRMAWLLLIGMIHAYMLWYGDILVMYSICGMVLYLVRRLSPKILIPLSLISLLVTVAVMGLSGFYFANLQRALDDYDAQQAALVEVPDGSAPSEAVVAEHETQDGEGEAAPDEQSEGEVEADPEKTTPLLWGATVADAREVLGEMRGEWSPPQEKIDAEIKAYKGSYLDELKFRAPVVAWFQVFMLLFFGWRALSMMLLGMALFKWGVLAASRSSKTYVLMAVLGFGIGLPLIWTGLQRNLAADYDFIAAQFNNSHFNYFGSVFVALGWIGIIMLLCRSGVLEWLKTSLGAVGRMAFTNYLMHTIVCTTIFNQRGGLGFGKFAELDRVELLTVVVVIFALQMIISPLWLKHFRFGPFEWLWRSLTYWQLQAMRRVA